MLLNSYDIIFKRNRVRDKLFKTTSRRKSPGVEGAKDGYLFGVKIRLLLSLFWFSSLPSEEALPRRFRVFSSFDTSVLVLGRETRT